MTTPTPSVTAQLADAREAIQRIIECRIACCSDKPALAQSEAVAWLCTRSLTKGSRAMDEPCVATNPAYVKAHPNYDWQPLYATPPHDKDGGDKRDVERLWFPQFCVAHRADGFVLVWTSPFGHVSDVATFQKKEYAEFVAKACDAYKRDAAIAAKP